MSTAGARIALIGAVCATVGACAPPATFDDVHQAAIRDSVGVFLEAYRQYAAVGQWDALLDLYDDTADFRWLEDGAVAYGSVAAIRDAIGAAAPGTRIVTTHEQVRITPLAPGRAWVSMQFHSTFLGADGPSYAFAGVITMVLRHDADGWKIVGGHASTAPPDTAAGG